MQSGLRQYRNASFNANAARDTEIAAFALCNRRLEEAGDPIQRIHALHKNHELWSILMRDVGMEGNRLPPPLKEELLRLAVWATSYSIRAMAEDLPLAPLVNVNRNIADGLRAQSGAMPVAPPPAEAAAGTVQFG